MSVVKGKRSESRLEFDNAFYRVYNDAVQATTHNLYGKGNEIYINSQSREIMRLVNLLLFYIRKANSIYPTCQEELNTRRVAMDEAIGVCFALITQYHLAFRTLGVKEEKHCEEYKHIYHEINMIKAWRRSDNKVKFC